MKRPLVWIPIVLALAALLGFTLYRRIRGSQTAEETPPIPVIVARPQRGEIEKTLDYAGTLEPQALVTVTSKIEGRIERILVREGDAVQAGGLLIQMEDDAVRLELSRARAALEAAQAQLDKARRGVRPEELDNARALLHQAEEDFETWQQSFRRSERLYQEGALPRARFEEAERQLRDARTRLENARRSLSMMEKGAGPEEQRLAEANLKAAQAQARLASLQMDFTRIRSPLAGRVARLLIDEGNLASRTTPLMILVQDDPMLLRIPVPELHYERFSSGWKTISARVRINALPVEGELVGAITSISPTVDPASRTFTVEVRLENRSGRLKAGMYGEVRFVLERRTDALRVPATAVVERGGRQGLFVVEPGQEPRVRFRPIVPGIRTPSEVEAAEGLAGGERVVVEGNAFLEEGQKVAPLER